MPENQASAYQQIPVDKIVPSPYQARKDFDAGKLKELAQTMKDHGLMNPILVRPIPHTSPSPLKGEGKADGNSQSAAGEGETYEIMAGERRWRAAKLLGWQTIEAKVEAVGDQQASQRVMVENLQREDLSTIEQAEGYRRLSMPPFNFGQEKLAQKVGKERSLITKYLAVAEMAAQHHSDVNRFTFLGLAHLLELSRLPKPEDQSALADQALKQDLSVRQLKALVDQKQGKGKPAPHHAVSAATDPLADIWTRMMNDPRAAAGHGNWHVTYGPHKTPVMKGPAGNGWQFCFQSPGFTPKGDLKQWFLRLADAMGNTREEETKTNKVLDAFVPNNDEEFKQLVEEGKRLNLPTTPQQWAQVEAVAPQGPAAVYGWTHGPNSLMARKARGLTWNDLGEADAITGCQKAIECLRTGQPKESGPVEAAPPLQKKPLDPKIAAMIARQMAKGKIL